MTNRNEVYKPSIKQPTLRSYSAIGSTQIRKRCPKCRKRQAKTERVDYGQGGVTLFCECGHIREEKNK